MSIGQQSIVNLGTAIPSPTIPPSNPGDPAWEVAMLYPAQGTWTDDKFFELDRNTNRPMELVDGCLRILPIWNDDHQAILSFLNDLFKAFVVSRQLGRVRFAPLPVRFGFKNVREPDLMFFRKERPRGPKGYPEGVDLAIEIVSESSEDRKRDYQEKREVYAAAAVSEYWIVDPQEQTITVLALDGPQYREHGVFRPGDQATSVELNGLSISVTEVFAAANE